MIIIASVAPSHIIYLFVLVVGLIHNGSAFQTTTTTTTTSRGNFPIRYNNQANLMRRKIISRPSLQSSSPVSSSCHRRSLNTILSESVSSSSTSSSSSSSSTNVTTNVDVEIEIEIDADVDTPSTNVTTNFDIDNTNTNTKTTEGTLSLIHI